MFFRVYIESLSLSICLWNVFNQVLCASKQWIYSLRIGISRNLHDAKQKTKKTIVKIKCRVRQMEIYGKSMRCKKQSTIAAVIGPCTCEMLELESATNVHENTPLPIHTIVLGIRIFDTNTEKFAGEPFSTNDFSFNFTVKCSG